MPPAKPWMSEFWTVVLAIPILLAFVPWGGAEVVLRGMQALGAAPDLYKWSVGAAITLAFGIRGVHTAIVAKGSTTTPPISHPADAG